jgi:hypothetical protein
MSFLLNSILISWLFVYFFFILILSLVLYVFIFDNILITLLSLL